MIYLIETEMYVSITYISISEWINNIKGSAYPLFMYFNFFHQIKNLKPLKESLSSFYTHFLQKKFPIDESHYCLTIFCWKTFFNDLLDKKLPTMLILGIFSLTIYDHLIILKIFSDKF